MNTRPIPKFMFAEFCAALDAADDDDLPDGAWWQMLEDTAAQFMKTHNLRGCPNSATHRWVEFRSKAQQEPPQ